MTGERSGWRALCPGPQAGSGGPQREDLRELGWVLPWLVFLAFPALDIAGGRYGGAQDALAATGLVAFAGLYVGLVWWEGFVTHRAPGPWRLALLGVLVALTLALVLAYGPNWGGLFIYLSVAGAATLPIRYTFAWVGSVTAVLVAVGLTHGYSLGAAVLVVLTLMIGLVIVASRRTARFVAELREARDEVARLAVSEERLRFARDLHDLLGHSLSQIVLKSEVARRVAERDPETAAREVGEIESVARQALADVREAVSGYRQQSLAAELDGARSSLSSAGIEPAVQVSGTPFSAETETLLGWAVREGATNVVRHSGARRCDLVVSRVDSEAVLAIGDDGDAAAQSNGWGSGLRGLAERMAGAGGELDAGPRPGGGFRLVARLPVAAVPGGTPPPSAPDAPEGPSTSPADVTPDMTPDITEAHPARESVQ